MRLSLSLSLIARTDNSSSSGGGGGSLGSVSYATEGSDFSRHWGGKAGEIDDDDDDDDDDDGNDGSQVVRRSVVDVSIG